MPDNRSARETRELSKEEARLLIKAIEELEREESEQQVRKAQVEDAQRKSA